MLCCLLSRPRLKLNLFYSLSFHWLRIIASHLLFYFYGISTPIFLNLSIYLLIHFRHSVISICLFLPRMMMMIVMESKKIIFFLYFASFAEPTTLILGQPEMYIDTTSTINLTCIVQGLNEPPSYIQWTHNGYEINYDR